MDSVLINAATDSNDRTANGATKQVQTRTERRRRRNNNKKFTCGREMQWGDGIIDTTTQKWQTDAVCVPNISQ